MWGSLRTIAALIFACVSIPALAQSIQGSGSTFAYPLIATWSQAYLHARADGGDFVPSDAGVDYEPIGSLGGFLRLDQPEIDFAATDTPVSPDELNRRGLAQFPFAIGGIVAAVNLEGVRPGELKLTGALLADIYLGKVQNWADPSIKDINPGLSLPDRRIAVMHRQDGSGTTFNWTKYLSESSAEWKSKYGADTLLAWPLGTAVKGSTGMVAAVRETKGAIGYVEYGQAMRASLGYASLKNSAGLFVNPEPAAFQAAVASVDWAGAKDFHLSLIDAPGEQSYPITAATFVVMHQADRSQSTTDRVLRFFEFALDKGGGEAAALGYIPLPAPVVSLIKAYWRAKLDFGS